MSANLPPPADPLAALLLKVAVQSTHPAVRAWASALLRRPGGRGGRAGAGAGGRVEAGPGREGRAGEVTGGTPRATPGGRTPADTADASAP